jgi:hypothetical protein
MQLVSELCYFCNRKLESIHKHHVVPVVCGGAKGQTVGCCLNCSRQIHMLFTVKELANKTPEETRDTPLMQSYINWISNRQGDFKVKLSKRIKRKK